MAPFAEEMQRLDCRDEEVVGVRELKIPTGGTGKLRNGEGSRARDWSGYLTRESEARRPSALKAAFKHLSIPGIISLGGGLPLPTYFPIHEVVVTVPTVGKWSEEETANEGSRIKVVKYLHHANDTNVINGGTKGGITNGVMGVTDGMETLKVKTEVPTVVLSTTLQYGVGTGDPHLISFLKQHTQMVHNPPYEDWSTTLTCGNTYSFYTCLRMLVERGDYLIMEEYTYSSAISTCGPMGIKILGIEMDEQGMTATGLDRSLSNWDLFARGARKPRNPTGASMYLQRRKDIYRVCQKHNLIIIEDEPYYFLQMDPYEGKPTVVPDLSNIDLIKSLIPSFMSLDVDGRVLRLDSLSKTVAPGLRLAWLSGPTQLIERATRHLELSTQAPSGLSQSICYDLLAKHWHHSGFLAWLGYIRKEYTRRRDVAAAAMDKYLPKEVASWTVPTAGMFFWVKVTAPEGHSWRGSLETTLFERCLEEKVLIIPGGFFHAEGDPEGQGNVHDDTGICYFRGTFAAAEEDEVVRGIERFGRSIRGEFGL